MYLVREIKSVMLKGIQETILQWEKRIEILYDTGD